MLRIYSFGKINIHKDKITTIHQINMRFNLMRNQKKHINQKNNQKEDHYNQGEVLINQDFNKIIKERRMSRNNNNK